MAIPTSGVTLATAYSPAATWNSTITLIGDSENIIGENSDGETATLNRSSRELADNVKYVNDLMTHAALNSSVYTPGTVVGFTLLDDMNMLLQRYMNKILRYKLTITLQDNLTLDGSYDEYFDFSNLCGLDEIEINLNSKTITIDTGYTAKDQLFHFNKCNVPFIYLRNGSITDSIGNVVGNLIKVEKCNGFVELYDLALESTVGALSAGHISFSQSRGMVGNCTFEAGYSGISASYCSHVYSKDNSTVATSCHTYGLAASSGGIIRKYGVTQPSGTSGAESESTGGTID